MQLTKKQETEIFKVYDTWLFSYLNGDVKTYDSFLDDEYHFIGSTNNEEFLNRKDTTQFFANTSDQLSGKCDLRKESRTIEIFGEIVFITHVFDAWFLNGSVFNYYGRFRFTSTLRENKEGWRFIYQHFSTPDTTTEEGETIGFDKVNKENKELRQAIQRRTFELKQKNRELQIEGALQRIRAQATAMQKSEDLLDVVVTMRTEFIKLGHEAHYFWHMLWQLEIYKKAMTSGDGNRIGFVMELPRHIHGDIPLLDKWEKSDEPTVVYAMDVEEALSYIHKMVTLGDFQHIDPQAPTEDDIRHIGGLTFIMARTTHGEIGYSLPGVVTDPPSEDLDILVRFARAFDLAHLRFLDLKKAEKQAREVQIELALEKVRSRTMAMQKSEELGDLSLVLVDQVLKLGISTWFCAFNIYDEEKGSLEWGSNGEGIFPEYRTPREGIFLEYYEAGQKGETLLVNTIDEKACPPHYEYLCSLPGVGEQLLKMKDAGIPFPTSQIDHVAFFKYGYILFITFDPVPESHHTFQRFAKVFEQTYTRFLDLQKAERQAHEVQIELALEKVRNRTMAMQNSAELPEAANNLFLQVQELGIPAWSAGYCIWDETKENATANMSSEGELQKPFSLPNKGVGYNFQKPFDNGEHFYVEELGGETIVKHYEFMRTLPIFGEVIDGIIAAGYPLPTFQIFHIVFFNYGYVMFITYEAVPDAHDIFRRFGKVFEQTYTRFLDLQKAEEQAREKEIELALEKVRSRTMGMHKSEEIQEVIQVVYDQFVLLNIHIEHTGFLLDYKESENMNIWLADDNAVFPQISIPYFDSPHWNSFLEAKKNGKGFFANHLDFEVKNQFYNDLFEFIPDLSMEVKEHYLNCPALAISTVLMDNVGLYIENFSGTPYTDEENNILKRFGSVFQQAYTRFLDLQKAEAQARESQIEAAVERVRAEAMAMHSTTDFEKVSKQLLKQVQQLNLEGFTGAQIILIDEKEFLTTWDFSSPGNISDPSSRTIRYEAQKFPIMGIEVLNKWKGGESYFVMDFDLDKLNAAVKEWEDIDINIAKAVKDAVSGGHLTHQWDACGRISNGMIAFDMVKFPDDDVRNITIKMTHAFEQAYTRFLDLQKAEAQARKAQIEAALERTRTQSMLMQHSDELDSTIQVFHEQLHLLGIDSEFSYLWLPDEEKSTHLFWATWFETQIKKGKLEALPSLKTKSVIYPLDKTEASIATCYVAWESGETIHVNPVLAEGVKEYFETWEELLHGAEQFQEDNFREGIFYVDAYMKYGCFGIMIREQLSDDEKNILTRFTKEFERTYTRFLDLQKAEAQAKEAQIEAGLERVRSRSLAMHNTSEIQSVIHSVHEELLKLNISIHGGSFLVINKDIDTELYAWGAGGTADTSSLIHIPHFEMPFVTNIIKEVKKGSGFIAEEFTQKEKREYFTELFQHAPWSKLSNRKKKETLNSEGGYSRSCYISNHTSILIINHTGKKFSESENEILKRFAKVFEQSYTRFLDLQKAEAQAKEAQIEAALERVRATSLAMHNTTQLQDVVNIVTTQLNLLNLQLSGVFISIKAENQGKEMCSWVNVKLSQVRQVTLPYYRGKIHTELVNFIKKGSGLKSEQYSTNIVKSWFSFLFTTPGWKERPETAKKALMDSFSNYSRSSWACKNTTLTILRFYGKPFNNEEHRILERFSKVFEQSYTRFLDLQKAEARAREAQIENSLERIRAQAMAMRTSEDLEDSTKIVFEELEKLNLSIQRSGIGIFDKDTKDCHLWTTVTTPDGKQELLTGITSLTIHPMLIKTFESWGPQESFLYVLEGKELRDYYRLISKGDFHLSNETIEESKSLPKEYYFYTPFSAGGLYFFSDSEPLESDKQIVTRFAEVFNLTYTRFLDIQKAEARAREAQIEVALEKVRSHSLAVNKLEEFNDVVGVVFEKLSELDIPASSVTIVVNKEDFKKFDVFGCAVSDSGLSTIKFELPYFSTPIMDDMIVVRKMQEGYYSKVYSYEEKNEYYEYAFNKTELKNLPNDLKQKVWQSKSYGLSVAYTKNSSIMVNDFAGNLLGAHQSDILKRFSKVFEQAYIRFLDLQIKEDQSLRLFEEKQRLEKTLDHLQTTQKQLIQAEKMASLGELTAGIAHEIQNPLNFVNNFSELSNELIEEMNEEIAKGDMEEAKAIANDIKQNLEKINHHGRRADAIVKGMLQHSRKSTAVKESTDINKLADEYLRLAYHGLKAKDKSFNANLISDFDDNVGSVPIIAQDIGRVILNLITNAFYAVNEKKKNNSDAYQPTVSVSTKNEGDQISISVKDNGNGIPAEVLDKIFQPFFTTKPTGQGTGLGLSLAFDIVTKGHGGELKVKTEEGEGSTFIIQLPNSINNI